MEVFAQLLLLLIVTRAFGEGAERLGQPASAGEILGGIVLAMAALWFAERIPFVVGLIHSQALVYTADVAIFFLVFLAGIEMEPREIGRNLAGALAVALGGVVVPLTTGFAVAWWFLPDSEFRSALALLTGIVMAITAVPATAKVFEEFNLLHTRLGQMVLSAALFDDVIGLILLAVLISVIDTGQAPNLPALSMLIVKVLVFFGITLTLGRHVYPRISHGLKATQAAALEFSALAAVGLSYGLLAEALGMHWIMGAFMAGLFFEPSRVGQETYDEIRLIFTAITSGFLAPLFFASIGLRVDLNAITAVPIFLGSLLIVALLSKVAGAGLPALWLGMPRREALSVGVGMSARGAVGFVVLSIAYDSGLFERIDRTDPIAAHLFSTLILVAVITTMLTPLVLRRLLTTERDE